MAKQTSFYSNDVLDKILPKYVKRYGSLSRAITYLTQSIDTMYRTERSFLRQLFTQQEMNLMLNNALSTYYTPESIINRVLYDTEEEAQAQFDNFEVDKEEILIKLKDLSISQQYALVDWLTDLRGGDPTEAED